MASIAGAADTAGHCAACDAYIAHGRELATTKQNYNGALQDFALAAKLARETDDPGRLSAALLGETSCYTQLFRFREALQRAEQALQAGFDAHNDARAGAAAGAKATVYATLGDLDSASEASAQSIALLEKVARKDYLILALVAGGEIQHQLGHYDKSVGMEERALNLAKSANIPELEASAEDHFGDALMERGDYVRARALFERARDIQKRRSAPDLYITEIHLAEISYRTGDYNDALTQLNNASEIAKSGAPMFEPFYIPQFRGSILRALGHKDEALASFALAVSLADDWRSDVLPGADTRARTDQKLSSVYDDYIQTAAELAIERHSSALSQKALSILMSSRALSLREQLAAAERPTDLPPRYYELLNELQSVQGQVTLARTNSARQKSELQLDRVRFALTELENKIGAHNGTNALSRENLAHRFSLRSIQLRLSRQNLLLSFYLGARESYLWTITDNRVEMHRLPPATQIKQSAHAFKMAVENRSGIEKTGQQLRDLLFGGLPEAAVAKRNWLIAADGALLDGIPFSALPGLTAQSRLISDRSLRLIPSEALLALEKPKAVAPVFVGVADPVYNGADTRKQVQIAPASLRSSESTMLGRLPGSEDEIRSAADYSGFPSKRLLVGPAASVSNVERAVAVGPAVIHFAVHVVSPDASKGEQAALALSMTPNGMPEMLTRERIATLHVPGALVVLSGCASQQGNILSHAGVIGLSRAWLLSGASAVLVTAWPTPDDSGRFFTSFYKFFRQAHGSVGQRTADALRSAQLEMASLPGREGDPKYWSAYSVISKE